MKIIQFTDIHIGMQGENTRDVDVRENLKQILSSIREENADLVVLTGDLCYRDPQEEIYVWVRGQLEEYGVKCLVIPGNHDDSRLIADHFDMPLMGSEVYFDRELGDTRILFLDTGRGEMSSEQWSWLRNHVITARKLLIFMHHPPVKGYVPYLDENHAFSQLDKFQELVSRRPDSLEIFCGHYHIDKSITLGNLHVHITPSCYFQIRDDIQEFGVDHNRIGYRIIEIDGKSIAHRVKYL